MTFVPRFEVLPEPQRVLWPELAALSAKHVLYGGTALALRLGRAVFEGGRGNETFKVRHGLTPLPLDAYVRPV